MVPAVCFRTLAMSSSTNLWEYLTGGNHPRPVDISKALCANSTHLPHSSAGSWCRFQSVSTKQVPVFRECDQKIGHDQWQGQNHKVAIAPSVPGSISLTHCPQTPSPTATIQHAYSHHNDPGFLSPPGLTTTLCLHKATPLRLRIITVLIHWNKQKETAKMETQSNNPQMQKGVIAEERSK